MEFTYDHRGNLTGEMEGGTLLHGYAYGAMNRISRAWNGRDEEASYFYNGLGQRIGREYREGGRTLRNRYFLDQTRSYHNLLGIEREGVVQTFHYDGNVAAMEDKETGIHYYLQDELGSPLRVSGYGKRAGAGEGTENRAENHAAPDYLTYGYDEFGKDLYRELEESGIPSPYDRQEKEQPFGYTGYRYDDISGTYFAQAREYQPENGRFTAEDVVKGNGAVPETLNRYGYCWGNPVGLVDNDGKIPVLGILLIASLPILLSGCGKEEEYVIELVHVEVVPTPTPISTPIQQSMPMAEVSITNIDQAYEIMDSYIYMNNTDKLDNAISYVAQTGTVHDYGDGYNVFDEEIIAWTSYWNNKLNLDMDQNYVKAMVMQESTMGIDGNKNGHRDVMQIFDSRNTGMWVIAKEDPAKYGYSTGYDPIEGTSKKHGIPKEGYPFLKDLFVNGNSDESAVTCRMSIVAGTRYLAYCYILRGDFLEGIERYNGGEIHCIYKK